MSSDLDVPFDRITYRDGQLLTARDISDDQRRHARFHWLHNHYLHDWGIVSGFELSSARNNRLVIILPGHAVDTLGRDILLNTNFALHVPEVSGPEPFVLTVAYQEDTVFRCRGDLTNLCPNGGSDHAYERPSFSWQRPGEARFGLQVPLGAVLIKQGMIQGELNFLVRRNAQPLVRPHIGWAETEPGRTGWRSWKAGGGTTLGLKVFVNTSEAGFKHTPSYFALLQGEFNNRADEPPLIEPEAWAAGVKPTFSLDAVGFVTDATATIFTYQVVCVGQFLFKRTITPEEAESRKWMLTWLGIEPQ